VEPASVDPRTGRAEYRRYPSGAAVVRDALRAEGVRGLYKGYLATLASFGPFSALYFAFYEEARRAALAWRARGGRESAAGADAAPPAYVFWACGGAAGVLSELLTQPLELV